MRSERSKASKTPIVYDNEFLGSDFIRENPGVMTDLNTRTTIKTTTEEHTKRVSGKDNSVTEKVKADFKETVLVPGEKPHVSSSALYEKQFKTKLSDADRLKSESFVKLTTEAFSNNSRAFDRDLHVNNNGHGIEMKTHLDGIKDSGKK